MISPCKDVALFILFPTKLVSLHSDFPSSSYRDFRVAGKEKEKEKGWSGTTGASTGPVP
jgi:hypothetical protein